MPDGTREGCTPRDVARRGEESAAAADGSLRTLEEDLAEAHEDEEARARRRSADAMLVEVLRYEGFEGSRYQQVQSALMRYGWVTLNKWSASGYIFERAAGMGRPVPAHLIPERWHYEDRTQVVTDTLVQGHALFREHGLVRGKWNPKGGAGLTTYFVGASIRVFPSVFIKWSKAHNRGQSELDHRAAGTDDPPHARYDIPDQRAVDPAHTAVTRDDIARLWREIPDEQLREALVLMALGYTQAEAAQKVGLTGKALERRLARARTKVSAVAARGRLKEGGAR
ncbi:RNA polymerase sigma factor [Streptomyces marincola]|uniref:RNA polymerase sigma factor n=1 Tax=Streptomyces marincola TaxID=2878388 RepID=UPI001CF2F26B|nr:ECF-type sigma factor [Streptomyces marincola]UCM89781.1 sigma-70 family RNA polymerase sigma factor [Streptomyces marincola]